MIISLLWNNDVLAILRPLVYVLLVMKYGKKSWFPVKVNIAMDLFIMLLGIFKMMGS